MKKYNLSELKTEYILSDFDSVKSFLHHNNLNINWKYTKWWKEEKIKHCKLMHNRIVEEFFGKVEHNFKMIENINRLILVKITEKISNENLSISDFLKIYQLINLEEGKSIYSLNRTIRESWIDWRKTLSEDLQEIEERIDKANIEEETEEVIEGETSEDFQ